MVYPNTSSCSSMLTRQQHSKFSWVLSTEVRNHQQPPLRAAAFHSSARVCKEDEKEKGDEGTLEKTNDQTKEPENSAASDTAASPEELASSSSTTTPTGGDASLSSSNDDEVPYTPPYDANGVRQYSYPELTADAARHKAGMADPTRNVFQNPLHHNDPDLDGTKCFPEDFATPEEFQANIAPLPPLDDKSGRIAAPVHIHSLADEMVQLTMLEMSELVNKIAEHYQFHEGMLSPSDGSGGGDNDEDDDAGGDAASAGGAAPTAFDIKLVGFDDKSKIKIIKEARAIIPGLGLKEAKDLIESAPVVIQKGLSKDNAEEVKAKLEALGAKIEIV